MRGPARNGRTFLLLGLASSALGVSCTLDHRAAEPVPAGISLGWTAERCRTTERDRDADGVDDECELVLARAFAPELLVDRRDCSWDDAAAAPRLGGGYLFAVESASGGHAIRIAYLPAYYRDCGWQGLPCATRRRSCAAHDGDSEIIVVETAYDAATSRWTTDGVFLSAHCFGRSDGRCRWYTGASLHSFSWAQGTRRGAPRVWVAKGKHANYPSARECDSGHWFYDSCDRNSIAYRFPVLSSAQNVGSRRRPLSPRGAAGVGGCIGADELLLRGSGIGSDTRECFWDHTTPFRGWQRGRSGDAPAPYSRVLALAAGF